ncbi:MAG TPA: threonine synthase [Oligoflexus sp.]|uniref:threonine synthase n=1 Tax=Oligoflexus sp. TaxID=1971216 RepID=UPI002D5F2513|nr:threonine synthase [Oligoflexus sp.]HYX33588.1 threonine synthase [Oligoflexus sp.]
MSQARFACLQCTRTYDWLELRYACDCGGLLEVKHNDPALRQLPDKAELRLTSRKPYDRSGVWRFREGVLPLPESMIVTQNEGQTTIYESAALNQWAGHSNLTLKHEGENPTGSFKDRGMTAAVSMAKRLGMPVVACASTGNTSSSLAAYAARAGLKAIVFLPAGKVSQGKMAQTLGYGAKGMAIRGDFDDAMQIVRDLANAGRVYMVNSLNPHRIEGQKTIIWEMLQDRNWHAPDWIVVPGGNLGNTSAFGKAIDEAYEWGWITKKPRLATIQAEGANPFFRSYTKDFSSLEALTAETIATAIRIGYPVNFPRAVRSIINTNGVVTDVTDTEIMAAKTAIDHAGIGCEPASAATLAGVRKLVKKNIIGPEEDVVLVLTGHMLKDPDAILKVQTLDCTEVDANVDAITKALDRV